MRVLMPVPDEGFDTTEVAVPWQLLTEQGHEVVFATQSGGRPPACDPRLLTGVVFGQLGAEPEPIEFYRHLTTTSGFADPVSWRTAAFDEFDGLVLPGGHAPGMRQYLGSAELQRQVAGFWSLGRPIGAICHGVLVLARSIDATTGRSVLYDRRTTCLPKSMERSAFFATAWRLGRYYRTYPAYVEDEVTAALADPSQLIVGPRTLRRGTRTNDRPALVVEDKNYLSARWPGDSYLFARRFNALLAASAPRPSTAL